MRKIIPIVASALVAGAVGLVEQARRAKQASATAKAKRAAATDQHRSPRRSEQKVAARRAANRKANKGA